MPNSEVEISIFSTGEPFSFSDSYVPFNTYYHDSICQFIITKSELQASNIEANTTLYSFSFKISEVPGMDINNFRIKLQNTDRTSFTGVTSFISTGWADVLSPSFLPKSDFVVDEWYKVNFTTPFIYTGNNLLIELTKDNQSYVNSGGIYAYELLTNDRVIANYTDSGYTYPFYGMSIRYKYVIPLLKVEVDKISQTNHVYNMTKVKSNSFSEYWINGEKPFTENFENIESLDYITFYRNSINDFRVVEGDSPFGYKYALKFKSTVCNEACSIFLNLYFTKPGEFSFWYKNIGYNDNYVYIYVDGTRVSSDYSNYDWERMSCSVLAGMHRIEIRHFQYNTDLNVESFLLISGITAYNVDTNIVLDIQRVKTVAYFEQTPNIVISEYRDNLEILPVYLGLDSDTFEIVDIPNFFGFTKALKIRPFLDSTSINETLRLFFNHLSLTNSFISFYIKVPYTDVANIRQSFYNKDGKYINYKYLPIADEFYYYETSFSEGNAILDLSIYRSYWDEDNEILITGIRLVNFDQQNFIQTTRTPNYISTQTYITYGNLQLLKSITSVGYEYCELTVREQNILATTGSYYFNVITENDFYADFSRGISDIFKLDASGYSTVSMPPYNALNFRPIGLSQTANFYLELTMTANGTISYWARNDSYYSYIIYFYIDGIKQSDYTVGVFTGETSTWKNYSYNVTAGKHIFKWEYMKTSYNKVVNTNTAYISEIFISNVNTIVNTQTLLFTTSEFNEVQVARYEQVILADNKETMNEVQVARYTQVIKTATASTTNILWAIRYTQNIKLRQFILTKPDIISVQNLNFNISDGPKYVLEKGSRRVITYVIRSDGKVLVLYAVGSNIYLGVADNEELLFNTHRIILQNTWLFMSNIVDSKLQKLTNGTLLLYITKSIADYSTGSFNGWYNYLYLYRDESGLGTNFEYYTTITSFTHNYSGIEGYGSNITLSEPIQLPNGRVGIVANFMWSTYFSMKGDGIDYFCYSDDNGLSWDRAFITSEAAPGTPQGGIGYISGDSTNTRDMIFFMSYHKGGMLSYGQIAIQYSYNYGMTWTRTAPILKPDGSQYVGGQPFFYGNGDGYVYWLKDGIVYAHDITVPITDWYSFGEIDSLAQWKIIFTQLDYVIQDGSTTSAGTFKANAVVVTSSNRIGLLSNSSSSTSTTMILDLLRDSGFNIFVITDTGIKQVTKVFAITDTGLKEASQCKVITNTGLK